MKEFKIIEAKREKTFDNIERIMQEKSAEGWDVISVTSDLSVDIRGKILITLQRDK